MSTLPCPILTSPFLAPPPDFRYVGLEAGARAMAPAWTALVGTGALFGAGLYHGVDPTRLLVAAGICSVGAMVVAGMQIRRAARRAAQTAELAIVPWGVLVDSDEKSRVLHWPGIKRVSLEMVHGRDQGTSTTRFSLVTIDTSTERLSGRAFGAVSLERLLVHLDAYAREASHQVALDLEGTRSGEGPSEPDCELLLSAARAWMTSAPASHRLELPAAGYRNTWAHGVSGRAVEVLRGVLRDRTAHAVDPRPFASVVAAELGAPELADDLVALVQSPHPVVAAVAKIAARKLGVAKARAGTLDEVEPFLLRRDVEALSAWQSA